MNEETTAILPTPDKEARNWAMICHLAVLCGYIIPFGNVLGPLLVWVLKKDISPFVDDQGKEVLNFQLTMTIGFITCMILVLILIGYLLFIILALYVLIMTVVGAINASEGKYYRYPMTLHFFK